MSYKREYHKRISIPYDGYVTYTYPASQSGGTGSVRYSGVAHEDVQVNILVDTDPFDDSVKGCNHHVDALTGSVVATEAAQVKSIREKGRQIGDTVVEGFFSTVRFEISTQITELTKRVEALLLDMNEKQKKLLALRKQMEKDYHRTAERYGNIFSELDHELENRVHALDQPVFSMAHNVYEAEDRFMDSDILNVVAIAGRENALLDAQIGTALAKDHARKALTEANDFLAKKQATELTLTRCKIDGSADQRFYAPVCCFAAKDEHNVMDAQAYAGDFLPGGLSQQVAKDFDFDRLPDISDEDKANIDIYFRNMLGESSTADEHAVRVKNTISKLYSI